MSVGIQCESVVADGSTQCNFHNYLDDVEDDNEEEEMECDPYYNVQFHDM